MILTSGFYRRKLPHWQPEGVAIFLTWRLYGSLPLSRSLDHISVRSGAEFVALDRQLDRAGHGPSWLKDPALATLVVNTLHFAERELDLYRLRTWVVMSNHVHVVVFPRAPLARITKAVKGFTARQANRMLKRTGQPFWQHESFDRWLRDAHELEKTVRYVEANPVSAGLVSKPSDWPWSSAVG
jgi:REP element-mobilizing transposase RayT